jgi:GxxExxY protein
MLADLPHVDVTKAILTEFYYVYNRLGFGYLEAMYSRALDRRLRLAGREVSTEYRVQVMFDGEELGFHKLDFVVDRCVVVEIKSTLRIDPVARRQLYNYLCSTNLEVGLLLHFGPEPKFQRIYRPSR